MNKKSKLIKKYIITHEAWYAESALKNSRYVYEIMIQVSKKNDPYYNYEFAIRWYYLGAKGYCPCVEVFDDAWYAFRDLRSFFEKLSKYHDKGISVFGIVKIMKALKFEDATERENKVSIRKNEPNNT